MTATWPPYDPGPPPVWHAAFAATPVETYLAHPDGFRLDFGPVHYRGRLDGTARVLVVGQDPSVNEQLAHRAFVGRSGQRLQGLLAKAGITRSYLMLNTFAFCIFGQFTGTTRTLSRTDPILGHRNRLFDLAASSSDLQVVLTVGSAARDSVDRWPGAEDLPRVHVLHPAFPDTEQLLADWNQALDELTTHAEPDLGQTVGTPYGDGFSDGDIVPVPRGDLPFGLPTWHGDGDHGRRRGDDVIEWRSAPVGDP